MGEPARRGNLYVGRVLGIPVFLGPSWFFVAALITFANAPGIQSSLPGIGNGAYLVSFVFALLLYLSVLIHELGHSLVARRLGLPVRRITLHAFVGLSEIEREPPTPGREALVAAAGPALSLGLAGLAAALLPLLEHGTVPRVLAFGLLFANGIIAVLNLLPGLPLDGGRVLQAAVWRVSANPVRATVAAAWAGRVVGVAIAVLGFFWGTRGAGSGSLYDVVVSLIIGAFVFSGATAALRAAKVRAVLPELRARELTRRALPVAANLPLAEALRRLQLDSARALVVVDHAGRPTAIVSETAVSQVPVARRAWVEVGTLARSLTEGSQLGADLAGGDLLAAMQAAPAEDYLMVEPDGRVYGVLAARDVAAAMSAAGVR